MFAGCQLPEFSKTQPDFSKIKEISASLFDGKNGSGVMKKQATKSVNRDFPMALEDILKGSLANKNKGSNFVSSLKYALDTDPYIVSLNRNIDAKLASIGAAEAQKDFQIGTTLYGGIEDITDNTKGLALGVNASRLVFDGGKLESEINSSLFELEAAKLELKAAVDQRAYELCEIWLELKI